MPRVRPGVHLPPNHTTEIKSRVDRMPYSLRPNLSALPIMLMGLFMCSTAVEAAAVAFKDLPLPVKAYVLKEAVISGVDNPENIQSNPEYDDTIPIKGSDLNRDGRRDYAVALCMFNDNIPQFWTNGYPCAYGSLMISDGYGGYRFVEISGLVVGAKTANTGQPPIIVIRERQFSGECDDYVCDFEYELTMPEFGNDYELKQLRVCLPDKCT